MSNPLSLHPDVGQTLALAIVESSTVPMLLIDGELSVVRRARPFATLSASITTWR